MAIFEINHPLAKEKLATLRDVSTDSDAFRKNLEELSLLIFIEASKNLPTVAKPVKTPFKEISTAAIKNKILLIPVLRAGVGMTRLIREFFRNTVVGFIGLKRDEVTLKPTTYYVNLPTKMNSMDTFVLDPMLATGGSIIKTIDLLEGYNVHIRAVVCILAAPEGIKAVQEKYPKIDIYTVSIDEKLNENGYIVPGLGDAGDRFFGTTEEN